LFLLPFEQSWQQSRRPTPAPSGAQWRQPASRISQVCAFKRNSSGQVSGYHVDGRSSVAYPIEPASERTLSMSTFITVHVILSLIGIASGLVALFSMIGGKRPDVWTAVFLATTVLTSVTGFPIPPFGLDPPRIVGILSLIMLAAAVPALYVFGLAGPWRWLYIVTATIALYLNSFVGVVQSFQKISFLNQLAPTQSEPPFAVAQATVLLLYIVLGVLAVRRFHPDIRGHAFDPR
jgi:hypothetical protein